MDQKQILKVAVPLSAVGLMLLLFFWAGRLLGGGGSSVVAERVEVGAAPSVPVVGGELAAASEPVGAGLVMIKPAAGSGNQVAEKLRAAKVELDKAIRAMAGASKPNHGGFVEKAQAELAQTLVDLDEAIAYAEGRAELSAMPGAATAEGLAAAEHVRGFTISNPGGQGHLVDGLSALQSALGALQEARGGNIGGSREKVIADMDRSATAIMDGFQFLRNNPGSGRRGPGAIGGGVRGGNVPGANPPAVPGPATVPGTVPENRKEGGVELRFGGGGFWQGGGAVTCV